MPDKNVATKEYNPRPSKDVTQDLNNAQLKAAIKQLNKRIASLEARLTSLENQ